MRFLLALFLLLWQTGCTYQIVQQQNGNRRGSQLAAVGGERSVIAYQGTGSRPVDPPSTYPEYNGYPGSGRGLHYRYNGTYYGGPIAPAYPPDDGGIPYPLPTRYDPPILHAEVNVY